MTILGNSFFGYGTGLEQNRINTAQCFFAGLVDIFLTVVLFHILDSNKAKAIVVDKGRVYAVINVIDVEQSTSNQDCVTEELDQDGDRERRSESMRLSGVSRRMIEQFFTEVEGPDRDWRDPDEDIYGEENRDELIVEE